MLVGSRDSTMIKKIIEIPVNRQGLADLCKTLDKTLESMDLPGKLKYKIHLIIEELCANHVEHGDFSEDDVITIKLERTDSSLITQIEDKGSPFNPLDLPSVKTDLPLVERQQGGLGIHLVKCFADDLFYRRDGSKNIVTIIKNIEIRNR